MKHKKYAGFTLAEVLITLGIIGVVAAMTMPTLVAKYQKRVIQTQLKKFVSVFSQAYEHAISEYGLPSSGWGSDSPKILLSVLDVTDVTESLPDSYKDTVLASGYGGVSYYQLKDGSIIYRLANHGYDDEDELTGFQVDVNGQKKPNEYGKDIFSFYFCRKNSHIGDTYYNRATNEDNDYAWRISQKTDVIYLSGADDTLTAKQYKDKYNELKHDKNKVGEYMDIIRINGWEFPDDYPW